MYNTIELYIRMGRTKAKYIQITITISCGLEALLTFIFIFSHGKWNYPCLRDATPLKISLKGEGNFFDTNITKSLANSTAVILLLSNMRIINYQSDYRRGGDCLGRLSTKCTSQVDTCILGVVYYLP